mgnify:CR=1 FL=1
MKEPQLLQTKAYDYLINLIKKGELETDKIYSLNIFNKLRNMFDYIFEYRNINKENKNILNNSDKIFLGISNDSNQ